MNGHFVPSDFLFQFRHLLFAERIDYSVALSAMQFLHQKKKKLHFHFFPHKKCITDETKEVEVTDETELNRMGHVVPVAVIDN